MLIRISLLITLVSLTAHGGGSSDEVFLCAQMHPSCTEFDINCVSKV